MIRRCKAFFPLTWRRNFPAGSRSVTPPPPARFRRPIRTWTKSCATFAISVCSSWRCAGERSTPAGSRSNNSALRLNSPMTKKPRKRNSGTKRPDIQAKLYPNRDPDQIRRDVVKMLDRELLGVRPDDEADETDDPAVL